MVWLCFKVFWLSKDNPTGQSERKKKKRQTEEEVGRKYSLETVSNRLQGAQTCFTGP